MAPPRFKRVTDSPPPFSLISLMNAPSPHTEIDPAAGASPVMAQFFEAKARQPDALVFFRMGDFYELFFEDAQKAAAALGITLTARGQHGGAPIPMCGVPVHAAEAYLAKLIRAGVRAMTALDQCTVPWCTIIVRNVFGVAGAQIGRAHV